MSRNYELLQRAELDRKRAASYETTLEHFHSCSRWPLPSSSKPFQEEVNGCKASAGSSS